MELNDWVIEKKDLRHITKKQYRKIRKRGLTAVLLEEDTSNDDDEKMVVGKSKYFTIYLCVWRGLLVAVKHLEIQEIEDKRKAKMTKHLKDEIAILVKMHHPKIVQILGITLDPFQIVLEYFPRRDITHFQSKCNPFFSFFSFSYHKKYKWTTDILLALIYLHERRPESVIHRDLKPSNILITNDGSLKITDFGLSKLHTDYYERLDASCQCLDKMEEENPNFKFNTFGIGTYWYMSPELRNHIPYDNKMDVWSLGLILYEIWEERRINTVVSDPTYFIIHNTTRHMWLPFRFSTPSVMKKMILQCLDTNPQRRPSVRKILQATCSIPERFPYNNFCCIQ